MPELMAIIEKLSPEQQKEVSDFALFLLEKKHQTKKAKLLLNWAGGLSEFKDQFTSLELQKKSLQWWGNVSR